MALMKEVIRSDYKDIPSIYSDELRLLLKHLLEKDGSKRPNINQVCAFPLIKAKIPEVLNSASFQEEFSHSVLHGRDVFEEMKAAKKAAKKGLLEDSQTPVKTDENVIAKLTAEQQEAYRAKYNEYVEHLSYSRGKPSKAINPTIEDGTAPMDT